MDANLQKALHDKLYDKRKVGALELERLVREALAANNHDKIAHIIDQLCHDYAYAIHQPYARNGGLIGLAAASIALGPEVARYLEQIVPPVLACFADQDARVRYYACESMYNISKTSKGEILPYFNEVFDALAKLSADTEPSVKNGAELLDRLIKDIVSESATSYVSVLQEEKLLRTPATGHSFDMPTAFSLARFMPLLQERIFVLNPFTRMFLVSWITLLDSIPDLEVISHLPSFLGGLFRFLNDRNQDVVTATQHVLEKFLEEIKHVAAVNRDITENQRGRTRERDGEEQDEVGDTDAKEQTPEESATVDTSDAVENEGNDDEDGANTSSSSSLGDEEAASHENWIPGQDVHVDYPKILEILVSFLNDASEDHLQLTALRWVDSFFEICPEEILSFVPTLLDHVLPALSNEIEQVRVAGAKVNTSLMEYIVTLTDKDEREENPGSSSNGAAANIDPDANSAEPNKGATSLQSEALLDYEAAVNALTTQFLNENETTRAAALSWLIMLQRKAPRKVLAAHDGTFPALLQTLSDPSDTVVTRDLQLLSQISRHSDDSFFAFFMVNLLKLFSSDRKLLETRGNLIIRQLCATMSPERIYRIMADCIEKEEDSEFASIMVQNLNNNMLTAPELADLRKKLRSWEFRVCLPFQSAASPLSYNSIYKNLFLPSSMSPGSARQEGQTLFVALFRAWCHNSVATISLCLLAQAYEQAYNLLQIFADVEMTVAILIQIDKLVQLLESPVFTCALIPGLSLYLRLQLLEPSQYPFLYKTLYGILMLLPQSAAFAALKNRLNSVSAIGYLHIPSVVSTSGLTGGSSSTVGGSTRGSTTTGRLKSKEDTGSASAVVKWAELLELFKQTQDRSAGGSTGVSGGSGGLADGSSSSGPRRLLSGPASTAAAQQASILSRLSISGDASGRPANGLGGGALSQGSQGIAALGVTGLGLGLEDVGIAGTQLPGQAQVSAPSQQQSSGAAGSSRDRDKDKDQQYGQKKPFAQSHLGRLANNVRSRTKK